MRIILESADSFRLLVPIPCASPRMPVPPSPPQTFPSITSPHSTPPASLSLAVIAGRPARLCAGSSVEAARPLCSVTMTAARRGCPCRAQWPQDGRGLAASPSSSSSLQGLPVAKYFERKGRVGGGCCPVLVPLEERGSGEGVGTGSRSHQDM